MVTVSRAKRSASPNGRILGTKVPARFPARGPVSVLIFGEAPGPNGADKSGIPFFGDRAGLPVYEVLADENRCRFTKPLDGIRWDGTSLRQAGVRPIFTNAAVSNAYPVCPTDDGHHFRAPTKKEMSSPENLRRLRAELSKARKRGLKTVVVLGRTADWLLGTHLGLRDDPDIAYYQITHPSPLGLMGMAKRAGKGTLVAAMKDQWKTDFRRMIKSSERR